MALMQQSRDVFMQGIGLLAASLNLIGIKASNNQFNYRGIEQCRCSVYLHDEMTVRRFYLVETLIRHNFVVFQTDTGHTFKVHLIADVIPNGYSPVYMEIDRTYWKPAGRYVGISNTKARDLKMFVLHEVQNFGNYEVGLNDCRHFARAVAAFLSGDSSYIETVALMAYPFGSQYFYTFPNGNPTLQNSVLWQYPMGLPWTFAN